MNRVKMRRLPLTLTQFLVGLAILVGFFMAFGLNQNAASLQQVQSNEETFQADVHAQMTISVELKATLAYVQSDAYIEDFNRQEANKVLPGEVRIVPLVEQATPAPTPLPLPTTNPEAYVRQWQMWWYLLTDTEAPIRKQSTPTPDG